MSQPTSPTSRRLTWTLVTGLVAGIPAGWILSYLAVIPFYLGLFFFLLVGLLIGAAMFRVGTPAAPAPVGKLRNIGAVTILVIWMTSLIGEYVALPTDAALQIQKDLPFRLTAEQKDQLRTETRRHVIGRLSGNDGDPGVAAWIKGFLGYVKWAASDGQMRCPRVVDESQQTVALVHRRAAWVFRIVVSLALLSFTLLSQFLGLARPVPQAVSAPESG